MRRPASSVSKPAVSRTVRQQNEARQQRRHRFCLLLAALLLAGSIWLLNRLQVTAADAGRVVRQLFSTEQSAPPSAPPSAAPLRGTIYDRNFEELAVSYRLYSLQAHPAELPDRQEAAVRLATAAGADAEEILRRLTSGEQTVELTVGMDAEQAKAVEALGLPGVSCRPAETRYYPGHAAAGRLLGFVSEGAGLSGAEALYDSLLQPGAFRSADAPDIDFAGQASLGPQAADLVLTIDFRLQKKLEEGLSEWRRQNGAASGSAIVLDLETGGLLAAVRQPGFDPNYFWQTGGQAAMPKEDSPLFPAEFFPELLRPLLAEVVAEESEEPGDGFLPAAVRRPADVSQERLEAVWREFGFDQPALELLPLDPRHPATENGSAHNGRLSAADIAVGAAALLNGGRRLTPWFLKAVRDTDRHCFFSRRDDANPAQRLVSPAAGVQLRRSLLRNSFWASREGFLFIGSTAAAADKNGLSEQHLQDILIAAAPQDKPGLLLVLASDYGAFYPPPPDLALFHDQEQLRELGRMLLPALVKYAGGSALPKEPPAARNEANLRRFLLSRRLNRPAAEEKEYEQAPQVMPEVVGLSLRQALRRLSPHMLRVQVAGSGRVVAQKPAAGTLLPNLKLCELTLEPPFVKNETNTTGTPAAQPADRTQRKSPARKSGQPDKPNKP